MAGKIWVYTLDVKGVKGILDPQGNPIKKPEVGKIYTTMDDNPDVGSDGKSKLFHAEDNTVNMAEIAKAIETYANYTPPKKEKTQKVDKKEKTQKVDKKPISKKSK